MAALMRVYPRGCGAARARRAVAASMRGLSPRVRGSLSRGWGNHLPLGSIPAGAGQPQSRRYGAWPVWVYPRGCGAAAPRQRKRAQSRGLSPRVRGSHDHGFDQGMHKRSIPAGAGQPFLSGAQAHIPRVYPRGCGAAGRPWHPIDAASGLSPRVRGSRAQSALCPQRCGSIPAGAGQPRQPGD